MSNAFTRVLQALPLYFDKDPATARALTLAYNGTAGTVTIADRVLSTSVVGGSGVNLTIDLRAHTISSLVLFLNTQSGYSAEVLAEDSSLSAMMLMPIERFDFFGYNTLSMYTSLLWVLLSPIGWALDFAMQQVKDGLAQMVVPTATGKWVDLWGEEYYGRVFRRLNEADRAYATRIIKEVLRLRVNGRAIEDILLEDLGIEASILTLHDRAWVISRTPFGKLAGRKYSRTTFEVIAQSFSPDLSSVVDRNRAAGTYPYYRLRSVVVGPGSSVAFDPQVRITSRAQGKPKVWRVGRTPLGSCTVSRPGGIGIMTTYSTTLDQDMLQEAGGSFTLGVSALGGTDLLGQMAGGGVSISEDYSGSRLISGVLASEVISVTERITIRLNFSAKIQETTTPSETVSVRLTYKASASEITRPTEATTVRVSRNIRVTQTCTPTESVTVVRA